MENGVQNMEEKVVDEITYEVFRLDPFVALRLKARLVKMVLPALGALVPSGNLKDIFDTDFNVGSALTALASQMDEAQLEATIREFLKPVRRDGQPINPVTEFTGHDNRMLKLFWACLEVNYADFFGSLPSIWEKAKALKGVGSTPEKPRSTKSGRRGGSGSVAKQA